MSDLLPGKYTIRSSVDSRTPIGVDNPKSESQVITDGEAQTWFVKKEDELYRIVLEDNWYASNEDNKVVVKIPGPFPVEDLWKITQVGEDLYLIKSITANMGWTVETAGSQVAPKRQVSLKFLTGPVNPDQIFKFDRLIDE